MEKLHEEAVKPYRKTSGLEHAILEKVGIPQEKLPVPDAKEDISELPLKQEEQQTSHQQQAQTPEMLQQLSFHTKQR